MFAYKCMSTSSNHYHACSATVICYDIKMYHVASLAILPSYNLNKFCRGLVGDDTHINIIAPSRQCGGSLQTDVSVYVFVSV